MELLLHSLGQAFFFTLKQLPYIVIGLFLAEMMVAMKWLEKFSWLTKSMMRYAHLDAECGVAFLMAFVSPMAANSTLRGLREKERISAKALYHAVLVNSFPNVLSHWRWWLPAVFSVLGTVGLIYFALLLVGEAIRLLVFMTMARFSLPKPVSQAAQSKKTQEKKTLREAAWIGLKGTRKIAIRILKIFFPVTLIVFLLNNLGVFDMLADALRQSAGFFPVPVEGFSIIAAQFGNSLVAFAIAGNLLHQQVIGATDVILTLFVGRIFGAVMVAVRMQLPAVVGIFGHKLGLRIVGTRILTAALVDILIIAAVYVVCK